MMLLTSSRKPAFKTKILCKKLALFFDAAYMTRGKMSMSEVLERGSGAVLTIVGEYHGNPGSLSFYDPNGRLFLSVRFSETSFDSVPNTELRYGETIFYGDESSILFKLLNMFMFEDKGLILPPDSNLEPGPQSRKKAKAKTISSSASDESIPGNEIEADETDSAVAATVSAAAAVGNAAVGNAAAYVRRLYIHDDRLDFYSNDRLFLRLYVKGIKSDYIH
ncbi:hypothetical protein LJC08_01430 [Methanimicrococcus sp. OttesenSCG-928-J09]|nr:hypothetical protein [Methanimicrococcus sp. OttesenSCG-928-J09]